MFTLSRRTGITLALTLIPMLLMPMVTQEAQAAITTDNCRDTFGTPANVTVSVTGNDCVIKFTGTSTWGIPTGTTSVRALLVGGGAAGYADGGGGGGGGGGLAISALTVAAGGTAKIEIGAGGTADNPANGGGGQSKLDTSNDGTFDWVANGGSVGDGWGTRVGGNGGATAGQGSATPYTGGKGGSGPINAIAGQSAAGGGNDGFASDITGTTYYYGGGGGGGMSSHNSGTGSTADIGASAGGKGGGGAGAAQRSRDTAVTWNYLNIDGSSQTLTAVCYGSTGYPGTTTGFNGKNGFGGGGGGGSAFGDGCKGSPDTNYDGERNRGGFGGSGVVIIRYTPDVTAPVITGPGSSTGPTSSISIPENSTTVYTFSADGVVTWSKGGSDQARFTLTGNVLTISSRDFETPQSTLNSNIYVVTITATDASTNATTQTLSVTITNANEAPVINSLSGAATSTYAVAENTSSLFNLNATDVDAGSSLTYSLSGTDADDFAISGTGLLSLSPAADFEAPSDADQDNIYIIAAWVSDGTLSDSQTVTITVTNLNESGSASAPSISGTPYKGVSIDVSVSVNAPGKVRFTVGGKRIPNCLAVNTVGSGSTHTATCRWKPAVTGRQSISARLTPTSNTFTSVTSPIQTVWVLKRSGNR